MILMDLACLPLNQIHANQSEEQMGLITVNLVKINGQFIKKRLTICMPFVT